MIVSAARVSLVIATVNRAAELGRLMDSLLAQEFKDFEILVVDQNLDDRIVPVLKRYQSELNISRVHTPGRQGVSAGRNDGWHRVSGKIIVFPDDDCWYPSWFLRKGVELLEKSEAELVSGRSTDQTGRTINGRFASRPQFITRRSVWTTQAEWTTFHRRELLERLGGFDEALGIGSSSHWQAAEGPDIILKALERGCACYYDPSLYGFHREYDLDDPTEGMAKKGRMYGRGMGYVLRRHRYGFLSLLHWASRPLITASISAISGRIHRMAYSISVSLGRFEGWTGHLWNVGTDADVSRSAWPAIDGPTSPTAAVKRNSDIRTNFGQKRREMTGPYAARNPLLVGTLYVLDALATLLPHRRAEVGDDRPLRVLVANWGHLGDVVTILPLLKFLERHARVSELGVLIGSWSRPVLESSDIAAKIHVIDHWALDRSGKSTLHKIATYLAQRTSLVDELRKCRYDMSIDTFSSFPSAHGIMWSASIGRRVGFNSTGLGSCLTDPFEWTPDDRIVLEHQLELLKPLLAEAYPKTLSASYPGFKSAPSEHLVGVDKRPYIVIHMGAQDLKGWVPQKWISLVTALKGLGYELVATGAPGREMEVAHALTEKLPVRDLAGLLSWTQFVATVANATAIVTIDSVTGHLAACFDVPAVILTSGRTRLNLWRPNSPEAVVLTYPVICAPCHRTKGCAAMACVGLTGVEDVLSSLQRILKSRGDGLVGFASPNTATIPN